MVKCTVDENKMGHLTVVFSDNKSIYLQSDYDRSAFLVACGVVVAPDNWDGQPENLPSEWWEVDAEDVTECPDDYYEMRE